MLYEVSW